MDFFTSTVSKKSRELIQGVRQIQKEFGMLNNSPDGSGNPFTTPDRFLKTCQV